MMPMKKLSEKISVQQTGNQYNGVEIGSTLPSVHLCLFVRVCVTVFQEVFLFFFLTLCLYFFLSHFIIVLQLSLSSFIIYVFMLFDTRPGLLRPLHTAHPTF
uniref:Uncharacterized protein n=1 Tax=Trypanosoma vivax (strain Y486) TaxID=1055687 RepID=G0TVY4_TRYVY|nr:hypothetical protein TVY486_0503010 [Trypanosoma vivax Y486]